VFAAAAKAPLENPCEMTRADWATARVLYNPRSEMAIAPTMAVLFMMTSLLCSLPRSLDRVTPFGEVQ
jgi:hypothetical protein